MDWVVEAAAQRRRSGVRPPRRRSACVLRKTVGLCVLRTRVGFCTPTKSLRRLLESIEHRGPEQPYMRPLRSSDQGIPSPERFELFSRHVVERAVEGL
jgi:hypothetical protein